MQKQPAASSGRKKKKEGEGNKQKEAHASFKQILMVGSAVVTRHFEELRWK